MEENIMSKQKSEGKDIYHRCTEVEVVPMDKIVANEYNPNRMPDKEMNMLEDCIEKYGFLFPILVTYEEETDKYRIIDGYHRYEALKRIGAKDIAVIDMELSYHEAVQLTVLMNRIKGLHQVELMSDLVVKLEDLGVKDEAICENLGMEPEEYIRLKQQLGISHAFKDHKYTKAWKIEED
jgi:ParB-like chromosome segregation protein Spo0J